MTEVTFYRPNTLRNMSRDFDKMFNHFLEDTPAWNLRTPLVDVFIEEDRYVLEAELPGISEKDIEIKVENNLLTLKTVNEQEKQEKKYLMREISNRGFSRSFTLPRDVDRENISASFKDGILILSMAKVPEAKPRTIEVKTR